MVIMHYTLGRFPQRGGGMTKYATDLMKEQAKSDDVVLLYPSGYRWWSRQIYWRRAKNKGGVASFELKNTLPIALLYGVHSPQDFCYSRVMHVDQMESLYHEIKPDVFHVHTLMGLPKELVQYFKRRNVKLIFTTHDYYGLCPKVNFIDDHGTVCSDPSPERCAQCNRHSRGTFFLRLRNSRFVLWVKNNRLLRMILR